MAPALLTSMIFQADSAPLFPTWLLAIIALVLVVLFVWLVIRWQRGSRTLPRENAGQPDRLVVAPPPSAVLGSVAQHDEPPQPVEMFRPQAAPVMQSPAAAPGPDNLEIIEGIGPKIGKVLQDAGVTSFAQLASLTPERITEILQMGGVRLADPRTWPEQARLAADGKMTELALLQSRLKGGRAV